MDDQSIIEAKNGPPVRLLPNIIPLQWNKLNGTPSPISTHQIGPIWCWCAIRSCHVFAIPLDSPGGVKAQYRIVIPAPRTHWINLLSVWRMALPHVCLTVLSWKWKLKWIHKHSHNLSGWSVVDIWNRPAPCLLGSTSSRAKVGGSSKNLGKECLDDNSCITISFDNQRPSLTTHQPKCGTSKQLQVSPLSRLHLQTGGITDQKTVWFLLFYGQHG